MKKDSINIAIFASGSGSNAVQIINHFLTENSKAEFFVLSNKKEAPVLDKTARLGANTLYFNKEDFYNSNKVVDYLIENNVQIIVLAGFLWLVPTNLLEAFPNRIINIHPALLPKHGGKGMYGMHVHTAVVKAKETETGITIHWIDEEYDQGKIILQKTCTVDPSDTPEAVAKKVQQLEHKYFPIVVKELYSKISKEIS